MGENYGSNVNSLVKILHLKSKNESASAIMLSEVPAISGSTLPNAVTEMPG